MPTIDDVKNHFKDAKTVLHPIGTIKFPALSYDLSTMYGKIWDNGTGGWNCFVKNPNTGKGGILTLYSGKSKAYSTIVN